jgi:co-chaperonin GroES (HSP10)
MIKPVNGHILIDPVKADSFISSGADTYQEIGVVLDVAPDLHFATRENDGLPTIVGSRVYFDSWLAAKYPKDNEGNFYWLVKWEDVRALEYVEPKVSEQPVP